MVKAYAHPVEDFPEEGFTLSPSEHERIALTLIQREKEGKLGGSPESLSELTEIIETHSGYKDKNLTRKDLAAIFSEVTRVGDSKEGNPYSEGERPFPEEKKGGGSVGKLYTNDKSKYHGGTIYQRPTKEE